MKIRNQNPKGGTELQYEYLEQHVDKILLDQVQITTSVPEKIPLHPVKPNILWQKNSYDQPNLAPWFKNPANHSKYDWYVFNSHWTYEKFRYNFNNTDDTKAYWSDLGTGTDQTVVSIDAEL